MKKILLLVVLAFSFNGCTFIKTNAVNSNSAAENKDKTGINLEGSEETAEKIENNEIRKVDFKNFTFQPSCAGPDDTPADVTVKNGEFSEEKKVDDFVERLYFEIFSVTYGDVNGDRSEDAVILSTCNTGGSGNFSEGFIYEMKNGKPALLMRIPGGDRAYGGLREAKVENGLLVIESNDVGELGGSCCPEYIVTTKYKVKGNKLEQSGTESRREIYPAQRVEFAKGTSKTTLTVNLPEDSGIKRLVVGARAGQTLTVTAVASDKSEKIEVMLRKGEADATETNNKLTARLKENSDYIIQLRGSAEKSVSVTIEIK